MPHAHDSRSAASDDDTLYTASAEQQPTARSGPSSPGNADDARRAATASSEPHPGLTRTEQSERWPLG